MARRGLAIVVALLLGAVSAPATIASAQSVATADTAAAAPAEAAAPQTQAPPQATPPATPPPSAPVVTASPERDRPFTHLFHNLVRDARRLPSIETAVTLGIGGGLALAVHPADDYLYEHATEGGPRQPYILGSAIGNGWAQVGFAVGTYTTGLIAEKRELAHFGSDLIRAQVLNAVVTQGMKYAVRRERPDGSTSSYSMPSGHTSSTFATAAVAWRHYGWKAGLPASAVGAWVGAGRVQLGKHYLSDAVFGAAVGIMAGRTVTIGHGRQQFALAPARVPGGAALMFTLVER